MVQALHVTGCPVRPADWPQRLAAFIEARRARAFSWGEQDCALFAADWACALGHDDPAVSLRGQYASARDAAQLVHRLGGLGRLVSDCGFIEWQHPSMAQRGDVALLDNAGRELLAIVNGAQAVAPAEHGLVWLPMGQALRAWML